MKDIYELLNDIEVDISEDDFAPVSELEKKQLTKALKTKIEKKKTKRNKFASIISVRLIVACLSISLVASIVGLSQTSFAKEIPLLNNFFKLFSDGQLVKDYDDVAQQIQMTTEDNGIKITLSQSIFDGKSLYITYQIESDKDLGEHVDILGFPTLNGENTYFFSSKHTVRKINNNQYVGLAVSTLPYTETLSEIDFNFNIEKFIINDGTEEITGNWNFQLHTEATDNFIQTVNKSSLNNGLEIKLDKIVYTPMSFIINYVEKITPTIWDGKWDFMLSGVHVKDDLGNTYKQQMNGGADHYYMYTFESLHPDAKKLIITPYFELLQGDGKDENGAIYRNNDSTSPKEIIELDEIVVDIMN